MKIDLKKTAKFLHSVEVSPALGNHNIIAVTRKNGDIENLDIVMWGGHEKEKSRDNRG